MDIQRLNERKTSFIKAVDRLKEACEQPSSSFVRDSVIQRFEFCWELNWKMLKLKLEALGIEALNPRDAIKEALNSGLIHDGNAWTEAQRNRNLTTHTYDEKLAEQVYTYVIERGLLLFKQLVNDANQWKMN